VLEGMLIGLVIVALAQLPWLLFLLLREQPAGGGGGGGTRRDEPPQAPLEPHFDWDSFEDHFREFTQNQQTFGQYRPRQSENASAATEPGAEEGWDGRISG